MLEEFIQREWTRSVDGLHLSKITSNKDALTFSGPITLFFLANKKKISE